MPLKIQDISFLLILAGLLYLKNIRLISLMGLICLVLAMPLFALWVFFTAQRLVIYAAILFTVSTIWQIGHMRQIRRKHE